MPTITIPPTSTCLAAERSPCLVVSAPVSEDLAAQCRALGILLHEAGSGAEIPPASILAGPGTTENVRAGLSAPYCGFLELGAEGVLGIGLRCFETVRGGGMTLSLQTATVYRLETLELVAEAIRANFHDLAQDTIELIEISLAEALSNAVIHGNLGIPNHLRTTAEGFVEFQKIMQGRMADPSLAGRRIEINVQARRADSVCVAVSDQGGGFDLADKLSAVTHAMAKNGRGLPLIRKATHSLHGEDGGRTLAMTFAR
ncbi:Pole remodelling regulatory diguanylate cyclase [Paramagnetospirillum magnetotacticum MS-1]|uniref:Pole remodelling regulatory diguanylate cyclase n=1 Tax=Paramagnetospirillum magnetotacticum MS-1 TaxID=272627 RepID=A0A0C2YW32_PARME|nr:ATP-binding protein [Paramagnetospirillum magnetotacticum]KIL99323.1 Pole remodelling regulatory diguanylate cyclase [Paramagnetospirillum magnetotacticum MS-1]